MKGVRPLKKNIKECIYIILENVDNFKGISKLAAGFKSMINLFLENKNI